MTLLIVVAVVVVLIVVAYTTRWRQRSKESLAELNAANWRREETARIANEAVYKITHEDSFELHRTLQAATAYVGNGPDQKSGKVLSDEEPYRTAQSMVDQFLRALADEFDAAYFQQDEFRAHLARIRRENPGQFLTPDVSELCNEKNRLDKAVQATDTAFRSALATVESLGFSVRPSFIDYLTASRLGSSMCTFMESDRFIGLVLTKTPIMQGLRFISYDGGRGGPGGFQDSRDAWCVEIGGTKYHIDRCITDVGLEVKVTSCDNSCMELTDIPDRIWELACEKIPQPVEPRY